MKFALFYHIFHNSIAQLDYFHVHNELKKSFEQLSHLKNLNAVTNMLHYQPACFQMF